MLVEFLKERARSGTIKVEVKPSAKSNEVLGWMPEKEAFKVSVKAPPEGGKANAELARFFSKLLGAEVRVVSGHTSKRKMLRVL